MTPEEREQLLKAVAECWPRPCNLTSWRLYLDGTALHLEGDDREDAKACFLLLDAMEAEGHKVELRNVPIGRSCEVHFKTAPHGCWRVFEGTTRAEAITRAFIACFQAQQDSNPLSVGEGEEK